MFKKSLLRGVIASTTLLLSASVLADSMSSENEDAVFSPSWEFGGSIGITNIDSVSARTEFIEDDALTFGFYADYAMKSWLISLGFDFLSYDDEAEFSQTTEDIFGDEEDSSSDATGFLLYGAVGPKWQFNDTVLSVQGGYAHMISSERSISYCSNCYSEDIDIEGGVFGRVGVRQNAGPVAIGLHYTNYFGSDELENTISLSISTAY